MTITELIKKYGEGKGEATMWKSVEVFSQFIDQKLNDDERDALERRMYAIMQGEHYDEYFAKKQVEKMYYTDTAGKKHYAPYWQPEEVKSVYNAVKEHFHGTVNMWDFYVAINMIKSDNCVMFRKWWPDATDEVLTEKIVEATINWLNDEDAPQGEPRTWRYFNQE